ncbi:AtpZ/AtpI family protein [Dongia sp.]|uniref:AtpZ/AtpI family protein n=1 Tax=Dongia sp. TaxID=1977262 RepID=UPI0035ADDF87
MTEQRPEDLDQFGAKLKAARERIGESGTQELANEGTHLGYGFRLSVELLAGLLVGLGLGYVIDGWLGTRPWVMLVLMILGLGGGILNVMRVTRIMEQRAAAKDAEKR